MSENSICLIPKDTDPEKVVLAIAYLCGAERIQRKNSQGDLGWSVAYDFDKVCLRPALSLSDEYQVCVVATIHMTFFEIYIAPTNWDRTWHNGSLFTFSTDYPNFIMLHAGVSEFWSRIDRELVNMFGGKVDNNDCDLVDWDYVKRKPRRSNCPTNGKPWQDFQEDLFNLPRLFDFIEDK